MADAIAAGFVLSLAVVGVILGYATRAMFRARRKFITEQRGIVLILQGRADELTPEQRQFAKRYYMRRWTAKGRPADLERLQELETLEEE